MQERRSYPRIYQPMPLQVRGAGFAFDTVTDNLSAGGLLSRSFQKVENGDSLRFRIAMAASGSSPKEKPDLVAQGVVTRVLTLDDGTYQFAARFTLTKLL